MSVESGDIIYAIIVIGTAIIAYRVTRSVTMGLLSKVIVLGGGLAFLLDFYHKAGWQLDTSNDGLWRVVSPDKTLIAGFVVGLGLLLRDRYAPMISEAGFVVRRLERKAEANLDRQRREIEADIVRQREDAAAQATQDAKAAQDKIERDIREAKERLAREQENTRREREKAEQAREHAKRGDPYETLGVSRDETPAGIKKRYRELMTQYHPDKATQTTPEIRKMAEERVKDINWAYEQLRD